MMHRGHGDRNGVDASEELFERGKRLASELRSYGLGLSGVGVHHAHQFDFAGLLRKLVVDARMVLAKRTHTNDCYPDWTFVSQTKDFLRGERKSQDYDAFEIAVIARDRA